MTQQAVPKMYVWGAFEECRASQSGSLGSDSGVRLFDRASVGCCQATSVSSLTSESFHCKEIQMLQKIGRNNV